MVLAHDVAGAGPALVLLHSGVCDRRMWEPQWAGLLDEGFRVVRCDFRGFGRSEPPDGPFSNAEDVAELLRELEIGQAALIGSSYGGRVALEAAARWPGMFTALALLCPGSPDHEPSDELRAFGEREDALIAAGDIDGAVELNVATFLGPEADDTTRDLIRQKQRHAFDIQLALPEEAAQVSAEVDLSVIETPCLAVSGGRDLPDFREIAARLPERLPNARHLELPWAGHLPSLERPAPVTDLVLEFLRTTLTSGR